MACGARAAKLRTFWELNFVSTATACTQIVKSTKSLHPNA